MIVDKGIFSFARSGSIDDRIEFPVMLNTTNPQHFYRNGNTYEIAGRRIEIPAMLQPGSGKGWYLDMDGDMAVIPDAITLLQRPSQLISRILSLREEKGFRPLIYAPGIGDPYLLPALAYAGIAIFDDLFVRADSSAGVKYTVLGRSGGKEGSFTGNFEFAEQILGSVSDSIVNGTLRELAEKYAISSRAVEILRILDTEHYETLEKTFPARTPYIKANSVESLMRPDLLRYRNYIARDFLRPPEKKIALLVPCTARKPYSASKTHRKIFSYIERFASALHKVVVTSPVGLVPEELEETYPPSFYDIPTIGVWFEDEKKMIGDLVSEYFNRNTYDSVVAYVTPDLSFIEDKLPPDSVMIQGNIRSEELLGRLTSTISSIYRTSEHEKHFNHRLSKLKSIASYQFGSWIEPHIDGMKVVRSYNQDMLMKNGKAMLVYNQRAGKLTITKEMGRTFLEENRFIVEIDDFKPTANIYAMGVKSASSDIRQEGEVVISHNGELRGVGVAKMHSRCMEDLKKGIAVKVRN